MFLSFLLLMGDMCIRMPALRPSFLSIYRSLFVTNVNKSNKDLVLLLLFLLLLLYFIYTSEKLN